MIPFMPMPLSVLRSRANDYTTTKLIDDMPTPVSTVTIPLDEYNGMLKSLDTLHNALEDNKVIIRDWDNRWTFKNYMTFTRDEALTKIANNYYKLENKYKELEEQHNKLCEEFSDYTEASLWTRIMRVFNRQY